MFYFAEKKRPGPVPALLDWETVDKHMAWSVIVVLGGGFALADATKVRCIKNKDTSATPTFHREHSKSAVFLCRESL